MARTKTLFRCTECGSTEPKWAGRCVGCEAWGTLVEEVDGPAGLGGAVPVLAPTSPPVQISDVDPTEFTPRPTGIADEEGDKAFDHEEFPASNPALNGLQVVQL